MPRYAVVDSFVNSRGLVNICSIISEYAVAPGRIVSANLDADKPRSEKDLTCNSAAVMPLSITAVVSSIPLGIWFKASD